MNDESYIQRVARIIDANAFRSKYPSPALMKRQMIANRKAADVLGDAMSAHEFLLDALVAAHKQVKTLVEMHGALDPSFRPTESALWPEIAARAEILRRFGKIK